MRQGKLSEKRARSYFFELLPCCFAESLVKALETSDGVLHTKCFIKIKL